MSFTQIGRDRSILYEVPKVVRMKMDEGLRRRGFPELGACQNQNFLCMIYVARI